MSQVAETTDQANQKVDSFKTNHHLEEKNIEAMSYALDLPVMKNLDDLHFWPCL
jgi:hypothetical protein